MENWGLILPVIAGFLGVLLVSLKILHSIKGMNREEFKRQAKAVIQGEFSTHCTQQQLSCKDDFVRIHKRIDDTKELLTDEIRQASPNGELKDIKSRIMRIETLLLRQGPTL